MPTPVVVGFHLYLAIGVWGAPPQKHAFLGASPSANGHQLTTKLGTLGVDMSFWYCMLRIPTLNTPYMGGGYEARVVATLRGKPRPQTPSQESQRRFPSERFLRGKAFLLHRPHSQSRDGKGNWSGVRSSSVSAPSIAISAQSSTRRGPRAHETKKGKRGGIHS